VPLLAHPTNSNPTAKKLKPKSERTSFMTMRHKLANASACEKHCF
jgi:hypothetical protein